jgi:hypothetical protein
MSMFDSWALTRTPTARDGLVLGLVLAGLVGVSLVSVATSSIWKPNTPSTGWCLVGQTPSFQFGFAELRQAIGDPMGQPTECEHGDPVSDNTRQQTSTGVAVYYWCTNTPTFSREQDHWRLAPSGLEHWTDQGVAPQPLPIVRPPDLRHPCAP